MGNKSSKKKKKGGLFSKKSKSSEPIKILILGAGECGKSTILKQIKIIHGVPFDAADREAVRESLRQNTMTAIHTLLDAVVKLKVKVDSKSQALVRKLADYPQSEPMDADAAQLIVDFWARKPAQKAWKRRGEFWHLDNAEYYFEHALRFAQDDFELSSDDIVLARVRTSGVAYTTFEVGSTTYSIADVGGQRSERKKWARAIAGVRAVMFVVNLAGYHQRMFEDEEDLKLPDSLQLFEKVVQNQAFAETAMMLVFNKRDIFERLMKEAPLSELYPEFEETEDKYAKPNDPQLIEEAIKFIVAKFKSVYHTHSSAPSSKRAINHFVLSARDQKQVENLVDTVVEFIQEVI